MVKYKGKNVSRRRYNQLMKSKDNFHKKIDGMTPKLYVPQRLYDEFVGETK